MKPAIYTKSFTVSDKGQYAPYHGVVKFLNSLFLLLISIIQVSCTTATHLSNEEAIIEEETQPFVYLAGNHQSDVARNMLVSESYGPATNSISFCDDRLFDTLHNTIEVSFDCQLSNSSKRLILQALTNYNRAIVDSLHSTTLYHFAFEKHPKICLKIIRANIGYKFTGSISDCFTMYFSTNGHYKGDSSLNSKALAAISHFKIISEIYKKWIHESFHFRFATNNIDAKNTDSTPLADRLTNEYIAHLMELDVERRSLDVIKRRDTSLASNISFEYGYSLLKFDEKCNTDYKPPYKVVKSPTELNFYYSLLGSDYALFTYNEIIKHKDLLPSYITMIMRTLWANDSSRFFSSLLSQCDYEQRYGEL
ncbi:hypothetical protein AB8S08_07135 [Pseudidiomarina sp. PP-1MA]|uniref:Uncharacterized protein n=1 Tax=Pseudidiomarina sp. PP-1MA TaxID=3237706 RepID=A0AB39X3X7_9GAMM